MRDVVGVEFVRWQHRVVENAIQEDDLARNVQEREHESKGNGKRKGISDSKGP